MQNICFERAHLTVLQRGWLSSNNVLFQGESESVLVDSGYCSHETQTVSLVKQVLGSRKLDRIVNTHLHSDHCGGNSVLSSVFACSIDVPAGEASKVDVWDEDALTYRATGQRCPRFMRTGSLWAGDEIICGDMSWQVIGAPGHDPESVMLYQPELELLISADALWENGFGVVFPELEGAQAFIDVRHTLELIRKLKVQWVIPGHGAPFSAVTLALDRAFRRIDAFEAEPLKHARHAAKVLLKFKMLEMKTSTWVDLHTWFLNTPYLCLIHRNHFSQYDPIGLFTSLVEELCASKALCVVNGSVHDV